MNESVVNLLDSLLDRQKQAWLAGRRPGLEQFLPQATAQNDPEALLDLIYNEIVVREELGETPTQEEYCLRFPELQDAVKLHFEIHKALQQTFLGDTPRPQGTFTDAVFGDTGTWPQLADYDILGELGRGGMGVVYKARHRKLKRLVALKMFHPGRLPSARELARFRTEAEAVARLQHPNIVQIFEVCQAEGLPFLSLELAERGTLLDQLQESAFTPRSAAKLIETLALAIEHAHKQQIVHRDLKPANVLFTAEGIPKITDFGLAKVLTDEADAARDATRTGEPIGTPRYMAPEQVAGQHERIGPATDVYALGALLYECLTGRAPFVATGVMETMDMIRRDDPLPPRRLQPAVPRDLETICLSCLHKPAERRYATARDLAVDLRRYLDGEPIRMRRTPRWEKAVKWCRRRPAPAASIAMASVLMLAGLASLAITRQAEERRLLDVRSEIEGQVSTGEQEVARANWPAAAARFETALAKIEAEATFPDLHVRVGGLLERSRLEARQERRRQNRRTFGELQDEILFGTVLVALNPHQKGPIQSAHEKLRAALTLADTDRAFWHDARQELTLLDAELTLADGNAATALARLDMAIEPGSRGRLYHASRAQCLGRLGRQEEAERERRQAAAMPPAGVLDFFLLGREHFERQEFTQALRALDEVLERRPSHFAARCFQAVCFLNMNRPAEAKVALTSAIGQRPDFVWCYLFRGQAALKLGDVPSAASDFQRALEMNPDAQASYALHSSLGLLRLQERRWPEARAALDQAAHLFPEEPGSWLNLAHVYWRQRDWTWLPPGGTPWMHLAATCWQQEQARMAEHYVGKALALKPELALLYRTRANWRENQGRWTEALVDLDQALRLEKVDSPARSADAVERARCLFHLDRLDEALQATEDSLKTTDAGASGWRMQAEVRFRQARYDQAVHAFDNLMALGGATADDYKGRGFSQMQLGHFVAAIGDYTRALTLQPDAESFQHRGWAYFFADAFRLAEHDFDEGLRRQANVANALIGRGLSRVYQGNCAAAVADAESAGKLATPDMEINRACIFAQAGSRADAGEERIQAMMGYQKKALDSLRRALALVSAASEVALWQAKISTDPGLIPLRHLPAYQQICRPMDAQAP